MKKLSKMLETKNASSSLSYFSTLLEHLQSVTKNDKNDEQVCKSSVTNEVFCLFAELAISLESQPTSKNSGATKNSLIRRNSLKKVEDLPEIRPSSRGKKLASLTKK